MTLQRRLAQFWVLALVATFVSLSVASSSASPSVSGPCSRPVANRLLKQLHLGPNWPEPNPAAQVLCGAFTGPGSQAMAVTFRLGVCMPALGWGVFRVVGGTWRLVMTQNGYSTLAAVGADIRETAPIYRPGDRRCFPSGGTHDRIWHWNGSRFVHSAWTVAKTVHIAQFLSPDHKIWCSIEDSPQVDAWCATMAPVRRAIVRRSGDVTICNRTAADPCLQNWNSAAPVLRYGQNDALYGFSCASKQQGITCTVIAGAGKGKGFLINTSGVTKVG